MITDGLLTIYQVIDTAEKGRMPQKKLVKLCDEYYEDRVIGVTRQYAALGADRKIDRLVRIWRNPAVAPDMQVIIDGEQYRIDITQLTRDSDGLQVTDLTLVRLGGNYDASE